MRNRIAVNESEVTGRNGGLKALIREVRGLEKQLRHLPGWSAGIPAGGGAVLQELLEHGDQTVPQIGRRRGTSRQNIQVLVNRLKTEGWVEMVQNPAHRRSDLVRLTAQGRATVEKMAKEESVFLEQVSAQMPADAFSAASGVLRRVRELLGAKGEALAPQLPKREPRRELPVVREEQRPAPGGAGEAEEGELPVSLL